MRIKNTATGKIEELAASGLFLAIGHEPNTGLFKKWLKVDETGYLMADEHTKTNVEGVFAAGDCVDKIYRQAITAAGMGCRAALQAQNFLETHHS